jgi:hypothetical protein
VTSVYTSEAALTAAAALETDTTIQWESLKLFDKQN